MRDHQVQFPRASMTNGRYGWRHASPWKPKPLRRRNQRPLPDVIGNLFSLPLPPLPHPSSGWPWPRGWRPVGPTQGAARLAECRSGTLDVQLDDTSIMRASGPADRLSVGRTTDVRASRHRRLDHGRLPQRLVVDRPSGRGVHYWCRLGRRLLLCSSSSPAYFVTGAIQSARARAAAYGCTTTPLTREHGPLRKVTTRTGLKERPPARPPWCRRGTTGERGKVDEEDIRSRARLMHSSRSGVDSWTRHRFHVAATSYIDCVLLVDERTTAILPSRCSVVVVVVPFCRFSFGLRRGGEAAAAAAPH